jgi:large subunit ribosomal protein L10
MNRQEKEQIIKVVRDSFQSSQAAFIVGMQGMTVESVQRLRKQLRGQQGSFKVAKNTLLKIATKDIPGLTDLAPYFQEQIAIVFAGNEPVAIAKVIFEAAKQDEKLKVMGGTLNAKVIDKAQIEFLATLPPREVLLAHLCGTLKAPITGYVSVLNQLVLKLLWALKQVSEKKQ